MSKLSFFDKLRILLDVSISSSLYLIVLILLLVVGYIFLTTTKKTAKRNKIIYLLISIFIIALLIVTYHGSLSKMFDYMMNNFFIALYFPNLAIYLAAIIITNIIVWISIFSFKTDKLVKRLNIAIYIIMNYLLALILSVINTNKLDIFNQEAIYGNKKVTALIELSSGIFIAWIIFLILYKIILIYLKKDYKPRVKKVIVKKPVKKLPVNFEPKQMPDYLYGNVPKKQVEEIIITQEKEVKEDIFTKDDYLLLSKLLSQQKEKIRQEKEQSKIEELQAMYRSVK
ncbi:MAG: hypothetical protein IJI58_04900 [Bacilli bacterium]|nr:hypothetical protein [Bacilli bacterium]